jgi:colanic acid biosynthesis glycosyl transferase WcaI
VEKRRPSVLLAYHFFHPDEVVSARILSQLAEGLQERGWDVTALTSNRWHGDPKRSVVPLRERWQGVEILRTWRPPLDQSGNVSRLVNAAAVMFGWWQRYLRMHKPDVLILGTDPQFAALLFPMLKRASPRTRLVHWCFDLFPDAILADKSSPLVRRLAAATRVPMQWAYRSIDLMVDIGPCMRERLMTYRSDVRFETLVPWALVESTELSAADPAVRSALFGEGVRLGLLYSGNLGRAHDFEQFLALARQLRDGSPGIRFAFACRGNRFTELEAALRPSDTNIRLAGFCSEAELELRLLAADFHLISQREGFQGTVVPSKFFGSLAVGRPLLYAGTAISSVARWIHQFNVGMTIDPQEIGDTAELLEACVSDPGQVARWQANALEASRRHFSRDRVLEGWDRVLRELLASQ